MENVRRSDHSFRPRCRLQQSDRIGDRKRHADLHFGDITTTIALTVIQTSKDDEKFVILDVRTPEEFADGHIDGAINIDYYADGFKQKLAALSHNKTYLVYCRSGNRSRTTLSMMKSLGFKAVYNVLAA